MNISCSNKLRILNTRPEGQNKPLSDLIRAAGGESIELPTLIIEPIDDWLTQLPDLAVIHQAIFTSPNAVTYFFNHLRTNNKNWPSTILTIAIGKATEKMLKALGVQVYHLPTEANSEHLVAMPNFQNIHQQKILLIKGEGGRGVIEASLSQRGATILTLNVYKRNLPSYPKSKTNALWQDNAVDIILFTSQQSAINLFSILGKHAQHWLQMKPCLVISERIAEKAAALGIQSVTVCTYEKLAQKIKQLCKTEKNKILADNKPKQNN